MKTVTLYLQQIKAHKTTIEFTDGQNKVVIPHGRIVERRRIKKKDYAVIVPERWAREEGII